MIIDVNYSNNGWLAVTMLDLLSRKNDNIVQTSIVAIQTKHCKPQYKRRGAYFEK